MSKYFLSFCYVLGWSMNKIDKVVFWRSRRFSVICNKEGNKDYFNSDRGYGKKVGERVRDTYGEGR